MAKATSKTEQNFVTRIFEPLVRYLRETRAELRKVTWPTREEAWHLTLIVLGTTIVMSLILGAADFIFAEIMRGIVIGDPLWIALGVLVVIAGGVGIYFIGRE